MIGNAHLDPAWMWRMSEGLEAFIATCRSALDRMDETPDFIFTCSSAAHLEFVLETDPKLFARIQERAKEGRWVNVGGWWVEPDCNLPSGESFARQALLGQQFFLKHFGAICKVGYCIDSFGHNANLPQLLKKAGMERYVFMRPDATEKELTHTLFQWRGPSGDTVQTYRIALHYSTFARSVEEKLRDMMELPNFTAEHDWMIFYGVGNHGGGPTKEQIAQILAAMSNSESILFSSPEQFFEHSTEQPVVQGEMQPHAIGCYSAHSELKQLNRRSENALIEAEKFSMLASLHAAAPNDATSLERGWKNVCFNQFHDILGGVSIPEACEDAIAMYGESIAIAERTSRTAIQRIASQIDTRGNGEAFVVFNSKGFAAEEYFAIELWHPHASERGEVLDHITVRDEQGKTYPVQKTIPSGKIGGDRTRFICKAKIPALGWKTFFVSRYERSTAGEMIEFGKASARVGIVMFPMPSLELGIGKKGTKTDLRAHFDIEKTEDAKAEMFRAFRYRPAEVFDDQNDTWGHYITGFTDLIGKFKLEGVEEIERGPLFHTVRVTSSYHKSTLREDFRLYYGASFFDVNVTLDWREQHAVCKLRFDHNCDEPRATYEIPYAALGRTSGPEEVPGQTWVHVAGHRHGTSDGIAVITDAKYSFSVTGKSIYVTAARSPLFAHHVPPHEVQRGEKLDHLDQGVQNFNVRVLLHEPEWSKAKLHEHSALLHQPATAHYESAHEGRLPKLQSGVSISDGIEITAIKRSADDRSWIVRTVERRGTARTAKLRLALFNIETTLTFNPFEVKTLRIEGGSVTETSLIEIDL